jgi:hypothetical protein
LNPARDGEIVPTSDYPKTKYAAVRADPSAFIFIRAEFALGELAERVAALTGYDPQHLNVVQVSRDFGGGTGILFPNCIPDQTVRGVEIFNLIKSAEGELQAIPPLSKEGTLKESMIAQLRVVEEGTNPQVELSADDLRSVRESLSIALPEAVAPTSSLVPRLKGLIEAVREMETKLRIEPPHNIEGVSDLIKKYLPSFVYYSNYGNLDSEIYLPHVVQNLKRDDLGNKEAGKARTLRVLFRFVRLEPEEILNMGQEVKTLNGRAPTAGPFSSVDMFGLRV